MARLPGRTRTRRSFRPERPRPRVEFLLLPALADAAIAEACAIVHAAPADGVPLAELRIRTGRALQRRISLARDVASQAAGALLDGAIAAGRLARTDDIVHRPDRQVGLLPAVRDAMVRLERALDVPAPPGLIAAAQAARCPPEGVQALESTGRIIRVDRDLAWAMASFSALQATALRLARAGPLTPAAFRDATGTSRKYVLALLEDLGRRGILARTPAGHVPGPRAPRTAQDESTG